MKDGQEIPLDFKPSRSRAKNFSIPLPALKAGEYQLVWKTLSGDGHVMDTSIRFKVQDR